MTLQFSANLSFMFKESNSLLTRYGLANKAGFRYVECAFPYDHPVSEVVNAKTAANVEQVLINVYPGKDLRLGDLSKGELGFAAIPGAEHRFKDSVEKAIEYAKALSCPRVHIMSGVVRNPTAENVALYEKNLRLAASLLAENNITALIEPINSYTVPNYYLNNFDTALELIKKIDSPSLKIMVDLFHLQQIHGSLTKRLSAMMPYIGHIQIAQVPNRNEPNTEGEINYKYIFKTLEQLSYKGYIGLEYTPIAKTEDGLSWIEEFGYRR